MDFGGYEYYDANEYTNKYYLEDKTGEFLKTLEDLGENLGGPCYTKGLYGSGKSAHLFKLNQLLIDAAPNYRNTAFFKAPDDLLKVIKRAIPGDLGKKFRIVDRLSEIENYDILCFDEGYLTLDAKSYFEKNAQNIIKSIVNIRHHNVVAIINSDDHGGILKRLRTKIFFWFYKTHTHGAIEEDRTDKFAQKYKSLLTKLFNRDYCLFRFSHMDFLKRDLTDGMLYLPLREIIPWWNEGISKYFSNKSFDAGLRELNEKAERIEPIIQKLGSIYGKKITRDQVRGYLFDHERENYIEFRDSISEIVSVIKSRFKIAELNKEKYMDRSEEDYLEVIEHDPQFYQNVNIPEITTKTSFQDFILLFYSSNLLDLKIEERIYQANIMHDWSCGLNQREIRDNHGGSLTTINKIIKKFRSGYNLINDNLRICFVLEHYIALKTSAGRLGGKGDPDLMYYENYKELGPGEVKLIIPGHGKKYVKFYIYSKDPNHHSLNPSFRYCLNKNIKKFPLFYFWPKWGDSPIMIPIYLSEQKTSNSFLIGMDNYDEYSLNFKTFNKFTFFYSPR